MLSKLNWCTVFEPWYNTSATSRELQLVLDAQHPLLNLPVFEVTRQEREAG